MKLLQLVSSMYPTWLEYPTGLEYSHALVWAYFWPHYPRLKYAAEFSISAAAAADLEAYQLDKACMLPKDKLEKFDWEAMWPSSTVKHR